MILVLFIMLAVFFLLNLLAEYLKCQSDFNIKKLLGTLAFWKSFVINTLLSTLIFMAVYSDFFVLFNPTAMKTVVYIVIAAIVTLLSTLFSTFKTVGPSRKIWFAMFLCVLCVASSEVFVFNSRAVESMEYKSESLFGAGVITADSKVNSNVYSVKKGNSLVFEVEGISVDIENMRINSKAFKNDKKTGLIEEIPVKVKIEATDDANEFYITKMPTRMVYPSFESSQYIPMQLSGNTDKLRITVTPDGSVAADIYIEDISVNTPKPFDIMPMRMLLIFVVVMIAYLILPTSAVHDIKFERSSSQTTVTCCVIALEILAIFSIIASSGHFMQLIASHQAQYQHLSESFLNGKLYLEKEVPQFLLDMENPYDYELRKSMGQAYYWDAALYNGHYYVYFGVVPVLLLYLPFFRLTGTHLANDMAIFIFAIFFIIGCFTLVRRIIRRYFPDKNISYLSYLIISLLLVNGSGLIYIASYADMYSVPIMGALAFTVCGLSLWLAALEQKKFRIPRLIFGSLCMALVAGCRPNLLLFSFLFSSFRSSLERSYAHLRKRGYLRANLL